ncbi:Coiled-coil domain-containing protein 13 [Homalodisca vitripennis]|nr:Coiled-coil domain-containing protein 13 [Homalodisca vitripennis]
MRDFENDEILFPYDASKRLSQQVEVLLEENCQLRRSLVEAEARLKGVVSKCPPGMANHGRASDLAASKIVELSKRVRELTADLEVARMRCRAAELSSLTSAQVVQEKACDDVKPPDSTSTVNTVKELSDKLSTANLKVCEYRNQCQQLKHELKIAHKVIQSEVGEGVNVASLVSSGGSGSWRGRAQQIQTLQQRLAELSEKTSNCEVNEKEARKTESLARLAEKEREREKEVAELKQQLEDKQRKLEASRARSRVLENNQSELRGRLATLLEKTTHDDQLIDALTTQLASASDKSQDRSATNRLEQHNRLLENQLSEEKSKLTNLQSVLRDKDKELADLEEKFINLQNATSSESTERSRSTSIPSTEQIHTNSTLETLGVTAEAERVRLLELLAVNNKRLEQERQSAIQAQDALRKERHKAARLETKLARQELEQLSAVSCYHNSSHHKFDENPSEELKCRLELLQEELMYLRSRLVNVEQEKYEDLRTYTSMLEHTRLVFMESVRSMSTALSSTT